MEIIDWLICKKEREVANIRNIFQPKIIVDEINKKTRDRLLITTLGIINLVLIIKNLELW